MSILLHEKSVQGDDAQIEIVGRSRQAIEMRKFAQRAAQTEQTLFLRGATGSGKDHLAEHIHAIGRSDYPFVPIDCGSMPDTLCENELFGHKAGAFTDGRDEKVGLIKAAENGTLFLNEVANMSLSLQAKFLRLLDTRSFRPIGEVKEIPIHTRIIVATNANVENLVREGKLRDDLYHRLNVISFTISPLREHLQDVPDIIEYFLRLSNDNFKKQKCFSVAAMECLKSYNWPGNIRELKNVVERAIFFADDKETIEEEFLINLLNEKEESDIKYRADPENGFFPTWEEVQDKELKKYLLWLLKKVNKNQSEASRISGLGREALRKKIRRFKIFSDLKIS